MKKYNDCEFFDIVNHILENEEFRKLDDIRHHGITRLNHCMRVAYYSYLITKFLGLNYVEVTEAALLHDFFTDELESKNMIVSLIRHPYIALDNSKKYFNLSMMQEDIIKTHMFPVSLVPPKYIESWIVDIIDDICAIYERFYSTRKELNAASTFLFLLFINYFR